VNGRVEKAIEAHKGCILSLAWDDEGSTLLSSGEDGSVKLWSKTGLLRSVLNQSSNSFKFMLDFAVTKAIWSPSQDRVLFTHGKNLMIKALAAGAKPYQWKAHEEAINDIDWNPSNRYIISGAEDCRYKVNYLTLTL
jgi:intraflagellar transport protein 80